MSRFNAFIISLFLFLSFQVNAQKVDSLVVNTNTNQIILNKHIITSTTTIDEVSAYFGKAQRVDMIDAKPRIYAYDLKGISFRTKASNPKVIETVFITYNLDDDKKAAKGIYKGYLSVNKFRIRPTSSGQKIGEETGIDMSCFSTMCMSDPNIKGIMILLGLIHKDPMEITNIGFHFKQ